jgi:hypothetical protein
LLGDLERVVDFDPKVADGTLNTRMTKKVLHGPQSSSFCDK